MGWLLCVFDKQEARIHLLHGRIQFGPQIKTSGVWIQDFKKRQNGSWLELVYSE